MLIQYTILKVRKSLKLLNFTYNESAKLTFSFIWVVWFGYGHWSQVFVNFNFAIKLKYTAKI